MDYRYDYYLAPRAYCILYRGVLDQGSATIVIEVELYKLYGSDYGVIVTPYYNYN